MGHSAYKQHTDNLTGENHFPAWWTWQYGIIETTWFSVMGRPLYLH
jgi:hypothetical protein